MKGKYHVVVQNSRVRFDFDIRRNITIVRGDSATGKTTLMMLLDAYDRLGDESGVEVVCERRCVTLTNANWEAVVKSTASSIVFLDEDVRAARTPEFARLIQRSDNYYVIITREDLPNLPYSVDEIYGIHVSGKYADLRKTYNSFYRLYESASMGCTAPVEKVIVEDSNAGHDFFESVSGEGTEVVSAGGKAKVRRLLIESEGQHALVIADGAAFGPEMNEVHLFAKNHPEVYVYLPESFEWIVLSSGLIDGNRVRDILACPEEYIESRDHFSWEQFFTRLLMGEAEGTYLRYSKRRLNPAYLNARERKALLACIGPVRELIGAIAYTAPSDEDKM